MPSLPHRSPRRLEAEERLARTLLASGRTEDAAAAAHKLFAMAAATGQQLHAARLLLLLGRAHREAGAPLAALPYALSCVYHARQLAADLLSCEAAVLMAQLWCDLGAEHAQHAQQELEGALPLILAHGSQELQARAQVALAEALMAKHGTPASLKEDAEWWVSGWRRAGMSGYLAMHGGIDARPPAMFQPHDK